MARVRLFSFLKEPAHKRRRIVLLFALGIVLPSVLLGFLAFRGIQNDRALLEKERLETNRRIADQVTREVDEKISSVETALTARAADTGREKSGSSVAMTSLQEFEAEHPLVEGIFVLRQHSTIDYPAEKLLYLPDNGGPSFSHSPPPSAKVLDAQRLEFREKDYPKALAAYRRALKPAGDGRSEGEILNAVARVQKKSGLLREAAATYEKISRDYGGVIISDGIPLGLTARIELATVLGDLNDGAGNVSALLELYKSLLRPDWSLEKAQFDFFSARVKEALKELLAGARSGLDLDSLRHDLERLEIEEKQKRERTEKAIAFQAGAVPALEAKLAGNGNGAAGGALRLAIDIGGYSHLVSIPKPETADLERRLEIWGLILDAEKLRERILQPALLRYVSSKDISWVVKDREGSRVMASSDSPSGPIAVRTDFVSRFPDWTLEFYQQPPDLLKTFLGSPRGIYSYMFLLIGGILVFGLVLTIRTVSHELELARMKSDLVSTISHEFKSPLAAIRQLAEMLHSGRLPSEERRQKYYDILLEQSERLSLLIDNVLNLARIEEGRKEFFFEAADLGVLLQEVVSSMREQVGHEGFEINFDAGKESVTAQVDREALSQALANLLDNAVKYSGDSRKVMVRLSVEDEQAVIMVRDSGIGIRKDELDRIFERFYRCGDELIRNLQPGLQSQGVEIKLRSQDGHPLPGGVSASAKPQTLRAASETGLPWTLIVANTDLRGDLDEFAARRRLLLMGMVMVVILISAGGYFIARAFARELAAARLQSDFVAAVSHEFRTPLASLLQLTENLTEGRVTTEERRQAYYQAQARAAGRLHRLVEGLLDFGRMEAGVLRYRFEALDMSALVRAVAEEFQQTVAELGYTVETSLDGEPCLVNGDREALGRALWNLLDNAAKYSPDNRTVRLEMTRAGDRLAIAVRDRGLGIPEDEQKEIFRKFFRGSASKATGIKGTGIGLAMVSHIIRAHGGEVAVESIPGQGSTFVIRLPLAKE